MLCAIAGAGCFSPTAPVGLPCTADNECPDGQTCDIITRECGGESDTTALRDDSFEDFTAAGAYLDEVSVEQGGFVGPIGYFTGGLKVTGINGEFANASTTTFDQVMAMPIAGTGIVRSLDIDYDQGTPIGVGTTAVDDVSVALEGELDFTSAGAWQLDLFCDDDGFLDIAAPGSDFERVLDCAFPTTANATYTVASPGWHRIRGAFSDSGGMGMQYRLRLNDPTVSGGSSVPVGDRMRVRADNLPGLVIDGFDQPFTIDYRGSTIVASPDQDYGTDPYAIVIGIGAYTLRTSGQLLIDTEGDYTFQIDSVHGHRAWLDNAEIANSMSAGPEITVTSAVHLVPGWHDFVIDVHKNGGSGNPRLAFTIASGPGGARPIATDHVRAIVGRAQRFATGRNTTPVPIAEGGIGSRSLFLERPAGFVPEIIDVGFDLDHGALPTLSVTLDPPNGAATTLVAVGDLPTATVPLYVIRTMPAATGGADWTFTVTDGNGADGQTGALLMAAITMTGDGGSAPFPTAFRYVSAPRELPEIVAFGTVRWALRQAADPSVAKVSVRSCDDATACETETFTEVTFDAVPSIAPRRFVQYAVELATDGDVPTALDAIEINYIARL
ncbi:MAG: hypothetical protein H0V17_08165 [Deltaproteobacteria bacterium]|nr:hypothetical protein [Deltaproteobacteria bacterium]